MLYAVFAVSRNLGKAVKGSVLKKQFVEKFKEAASAVAPVVAIVLALCLTVVHTTAQFLVLFLIGAMLLVAGMIFFTLGADISMMRIGQAIGSGFAFYALSWIGYDGTAAVQTAGTVLGLKALCVLVPAVFILGSWAAFKFVWNITPEVRAEMAAKKLAAKAENAE